MTQTTDNQLATNSLVQGIERLNDLLDRLSFSQFGQSPAETATDDVPSPVIPDREAEQGDENFVDESAGDAPAGDFADDDRAESALPDPLQQEMRDALVRMADDGVKISNPEALKTDATFV